MDIYISLGWAWDTKNLKLLAFTLNLFLGSFQAFDPGYDFWWVMNKGFYAGTEELIFDANARKAVTKALMSTWMGDGI